MRWRLFTSAMKLGGSSCMARRPLTLTLTTWPSPTPPSRVPGASSPPMTLLTSPSLPTPASPLPP
ncbi:hypothetical protein I314_04127 [Cryptococcus bacillisporus CA1873]|uniref:Unplaced genomic scaffold supercont1.10, whole genome shotgun sequence n=2 Tax=Cryptococcus gattii TaxID=552467 RepID=A0A0D0VKU1_CRYGA|nr:hypothetical protein I312_03945 [Cryptococcus bacillisporus CA1280]KIR60271.1 hypothetical protein I314_04127 [Cryptococcus bacillisporus CA1873]|eukprot:KIR60271.1 hypothetical protein I314_04127 [Cryptococcus gattii CA1873]